MAPRPAQSVRFASVLVRRSYVKGVLFGHKRRIRAHMATPVTTLTPAVTQVLPRPRVPCRTVCIERMPWAWGRPRWPVPLRGARHRATHHRPRRGVGPRLRGSEREGSRSTASAPQDVGRLRRDPRANRAGAAPVRPSRSLLELRRADTGLDDPLPLVRRGRPGAGPGRGRPAGTRPRPADGDRWHSSRIDGPCLDRPCWARRGWGSARVGSS